ncbi:MAG TPA: CehA/McbA family metallohydrolase [Thermohalobaculum sp.]|nr:CehA/McbA family metallohydrolase [Thermohalobaculum sp.]
MQHAAFANPGRFFRGNLHTHSTASDGALAPAEVCRRYAEAGYDFIALTDHFLGRYGYPVTDTSAFRTNRFTTIPGAEVHTGRMRNGEIWHLLAVGLPAGFAPPPQPDFAGTDAGESPAALARRCVEAGAFVALAHPEWNGLTPEDARAIDAAHAVEIYNHGSHVECDRGFGVALLDTLLSEGRRLTLCATDDAHFHAPDHFGGWVMVKAALNEPEALLAALKAGAYYASTGPELHDVRIEGERIVIACSPAERIIAIGANSAARVVHGSALTRAELPLPHFREGGWVRVAIHDKAGKRAWSNPLWLD